MRNFTQEESARIRCEMRKRLGRHVASKIWRRLEFMTAMHVNRCFPQERMTRETKSNLTLALMDLKDRVAEMENSC